MDFYNGSMNIPIITTKLHIPAIRPKTVYRNRLIDCMNNGAQRKMTLISAAAGYGKTTLISGWLAECGRSAAWLSLDEGDNEAARFFAYLFAAMRSLNTAFGESAAALFHAPNPPIEHLMSVFINELHGISSPIVLVLDDYHAIQEEAIHNAIETLIERMPPQAHVVIAAREAPPLPLARWRARNQLTEVRSEHLQFTASEAEEFLHRVMGLSMAREHVDELRFRTEGWISGLQLAALSLQGQPPNPSDVVKSFTGNHPFVLDYLLEEVLERQPASIQTFLLHTSILDRMCGPLCDAMLQIEEGFPLSGQETLEYLERANLFVVSLDNERRWYRYHHLFADLLRSRLQRVQNFTSTADAATQLHGRASSWYEENELEIEAFQHAAAARDIERAARLIEGKGMPLLFRGAITPVRNWLNTLPEDELNKRPLLWVFAASSLMAAGQLGEVESRLGAAENALHDFDKDEQTRDIIGQIAATRATLAVSQHHVETIVSESSRALQYLRPDDLPTRLAASWSLGYACQLRGDRAAAAAAFSDALSMSQRIGHRIMAILSTLGIGNIQEQQNQLRQAADMYRSALELAGNVPFPVICEAYMGLARIHYQWNDLGEGKKFGQQAVHFAEMIYPSDRAIAAKVVLSRLNIASGEESVASVLLAEAFQTARQHSYTHQFSPIAEAQARILIRQGRWKDAMQLAQTYHLPLSIARLHLAAGNFVQAQDELEKVRRQAEEKDHLDVRLQALMLQAIAQHAQKDYPKATQFLADAIAGAEQGGFIRMFLDEGESMARLLKQLSSRIVHSDYFNQLLSAFQSEKKWNGESRSDIPLIEPLSERELEILSLVAQGLSNQEIAERLYIALSTVKGHVRNMYGKLEVGRRTEAVARARSLGLL